MAAGSLGRISLHGTIFSPINNAVSLMTQCFNQNSGLGMKQIYVMAAQNQQGESSDAQFKFNIIFIECNSNQKEK